MSCIKLQPFCRLSKERLEDAKRDVAYCNQLPDFNSLIGYNNDNIVQKCPRKHYLIKDSFHARVSISKMIPIFFFLNPPYKVNSEAAFSCISTTFLFHLTPPPPCSRLCCSETPPIPSRGLTFPKSLRNPWPDGQVHLSSDW